MIKMFSSTATAQKSLSPAFDPTADFVSKDQKKKGAKNKAAKLPWSLSRLVFPMVQ